MVACGEGVGRGVIPRGGGGGYRGGLWVVVGKVSVGV